jgi:hypothetical protein
VGKSCFREDSLRVRDDLQNLPGLVGLHVPAVNFTGNDADSRSGPV